jgi:glycogen synthase
VATGFKFGPVNTENLAAALRRAHAAFHDKPMCDGYSAVRAPNNGFDIYRVRNSTPSHLHHASFAASLRSLLE